MLAKAIGAFIGMIELNELPRHHHPLFKHRRFALATREKFFLVVGASRPHFSILTAAASSEAGVMGAANPGDVRS
jgi:hypothetical protein